MQTSNQAGHIGSETVNDNADSVSPDISSVQTSITVTTGLERCLKVIVPAEKVDSRLRERIEEAAQTVELNGFRKGRAPLKLIKRRFGSGFRHEVLSDVINETFKQFIETESLKPVYQPEISIEESDEGKYLQYTATFEIYPEITLADFSDIEITGLYSEIEDSDIDRMIQKILEQEAIYKPVERAAAIDDEVIIDYLGTTGDGKPFDGGKADKQQLVLGSNSMIPGFEESIVGMSAGEEKSVLLKFPDDYPSEEMKGIDAEFTINLTQVAERVVPELDDKFLAKYGIENGGMVKFRADVCSNMQRELDAAAKNDLKTKIVDTLVSVHDLKVPKKLVANEIEALRQQMGARFQGEISSRDVDLDTMFPDSSLNDKAERRVASALLFSEIVRSNNIEVDRERVLKVIKTLSEGYEQPEEFVNHYYQNANLLNRVRSSVLEDQVVEIILEKASVKNKKVDYFELVKR